MATNMTMLSNTEIFLRKLCHWGFFIQIMPPPQTYLKQLSWPIDNMPHDPMSLRKLFHNETTFQANEDQHMVWTSKGTKVI